MNRTVLRTVEILEIISKHGEISLADLVKITGYPKTSVYDILHALEERAMIYRCTDKVCYGIGFRAYAIGRSYSKNSESAEQFLPVYEGSGRGYWKGGTIRQDRR